MDNLVQSLMSKGYSLADARNAASGPRASELAREYGASTGSNNVYSAQLAALDQAVDNYINNLINEANGDREFVIKKLDAEHKLALGNDDASRAKFLEKVSNSLEQKIGRIPYDYEKYTARELEDYSKTVSTTERNYSTALNRLSEDEKIAKEQQNRLATQEREANLGNLNARGILNVNPERAGGLAGKEISNVEQGISDRMSALERSIGRQREDLSTGRSDVLSQAELQKSRNLEDLTTTARRGAINQQVQTDFGKESANRAYEAQKRALERQRELQKLQNASYALT